jgi:hypothetical protein
MRVEFTEAALRYAGDLGWPVFPIAHGAKVPAIRQVASIFSSQPREDIPFSPHPPPVWAPSDTRLNLRVGQTH